MSAPAGLLQRLLGLALRRPLAVLLVMLALSLLAAVGASRLVIDAGSARLAVQDEAQRQATLNVVREFGSDRRAVVVVRDPQLWTPARLQLLERVHGELARLPFVERVDDLFSQQGVRSIDGRLELRPLLAQAPADVAEAQRLRREVLDDPLARRGLVGADGEALAIGIALRGDVAGAAAYAALEGAIAPLRAQFASVVQLGALRVEAETRAGIVRDLQVLLPLLALLLWLAAFAACRSPVVAGVPLAAAGLALLWTFGMMGWAGLPITFLSVVLGVLTGAFGVRESMRLVAAWQRSASAAPRGAALEAMLATLGAPAFVGTLAAAACFAGIAANATPVVREFALTAAFALFAHGTIAVFLVPLLLARRGAADAPTTEGAGMRRLLGFAERAAGRRRALPWALGGLVALGAVGLQQAGGLPVQNEPSALLAANSALAGDIDRLQRDFAASELIYVVLEGRAEGAFRDPDNLRRLAEIQAFIAKQRVFDGSSSLADIVAQANREASGGQPDGYRVPTSRQLVGQYLLLQPPAELAPYVSADFRRANIVVRQHSGDARALNQHVAELRQAIRYFAGSDMSVAIVGESVARAAAAAGLLERQAAIFAALLAMAFVVIALLFTSAKGGLIALLPTALPALAALALMRLGAIPANAATLLLTAIALAFAIDSTIRLFSRYSACCRNAPDYERAVAETLRDEAPPLLVGGLLLAGCFALLALSAFSALAQLGLLALAATLFVILVNLLLTPSALRQIRLVGLYEILAVSEQRDALLRSPLFHGMNDYQIRKAILISALRRVADGECLIAQGAVGRSMFVVVSGQLEVLRRDVDGERRLATLGPGEVIGEIGFVRAARRTADVRARGPVTVLCFDHERLERDLALFPYIMAKLNFNISGILGKRLADLVEAPANASAVEVAESRRDT